MKNLYLSLSSLVYDFTKPPGTSIDGDIEFYKKELIPLEGKILELGCGNGRLSIPLIKYNVDIVGIDLSKDMQSLYENNISINNLKGNYINNNIFDLTTNDKFNHIIAPNGFINLINKSLINKLFIKINSILKLGGKLIIDLIYPIYYKEGIINTNEYHINDDIIKVENISKSINFIEQKTLNIIKYYRNDNIEEVQNMELNWYCRYEIIKYLEDNGFNITQVFWNFKKQYVSNFNTLTIISIKKEGL
ncbi:methyltransferase [Spiroplasma corruscae]|uniref:Methyltransferase n=1 Tax=Spiroplasma corruscae TaxID=216934 RepID=A0A222ENK4_9MOLU|nr:class I SAM-dependent methyltransferase [Spiroplasma corruscae]ASP28072.1 methyltransferase [Spiroplasma corruscae]